METFTLTSDDTLTLKNRIITDFADDDVTTITFPNDSVTVKTGKNRNSIYAKNETGNNANMVLRLTRGSADDQFMQSQLNLSERDFVATELFSGEFVKRVGDGLGGVKRDVYTLLGGVIVRRVDGKENTTGDVSQAVAVYNLTFARAPRSIQ
jgi:hypothetical protein